MGTVEGMRLTTSSRSTGLAASAGDVWAVVADGTPGRRWYLDAAPFIFRDRLDRVLGGREGGAPAPGRPLLRSEDRAGFWRVVEADDNAHSLVLEALVRAPGRVVFRSEVTPVVTGGCELTQSVTFTPAGLLGVAYLLADLPAREVLLELVHRRTCADVGRRDR